MRMMGAAAVLGVVVLVGLGLATAAHAQKQEGGGAPAVATIKVPDMFCAGCELGVKMAARKVAGVRDIRTDSEKRQAEVTFDSAKTSAEAIARAITKDTGFKTEVLKREKKKG